MHLKRLLSVLALLKPIVGANLRVQIPASNLLPSPNTLPASTHATLTSGTSPQLRVPLRKDSIFEFGNLTIPGTYLLDIFSHNYAFAPYRVDIKSSGDGTSYIEGVWETYRGTRWEDRGPILGGAAVDPATSAASHPQTVLVTARIVSRKEFYEERAGFSPLTLLKNPMILMGIVALAVTFGMPKMMEGMDDETKAEMAEMHKKGPLGGLTGAIQGQGSASKGAGSFDLAGWMAGAQQPGTKTSGSDAKDAGGMRDRRRG